MFASKMTVDNFAAFVVLIIYERSNKHYDNTRDYHVKVLFEKIQQRRKITLKKCSNE